MAMASSNGTILSKQSIVITVLPPKRWESAEPSKYDTIRANKWFLRLQKRKHQLGPMQAAYAYAQGSNETQLAICQNFHISDREFRDYVKFIEGHSTLGLENHNYRRTAQAVIDTAYLVYCQYRGAHSWRDELGNHADAFGLPERQILEHWEVDAHYLPTNYRF